MMQAFVGWVWCMCQVLSSIRPHDRLIRRRGPVWRIADWVQIAYASSIALRPEGGFPIRLIDRLPLPCPPSCPHPDGSCDASPDQAAAGTR